VDGEVADVAELGLRGWLAVGRDRPGPVELAGRETNGGLQLAVGELEDDGLARLLAGLVEQHVDGAVGSRRDLLDHAGVELEL
jgi:hypothetical protein